MDKKIKTYQRFILDFLNEYAAKMNQHKEFHAYVLADKEKHHYQLVRTGWRGKQRIHTIPFHFDIIEGKIWLQLNNTDIDLDAVFDKAGIPKKDIVLAWHRDYLRKRADYEYGVPLSQ